MLECEHRQPAHRIHGHFGENAVAPLGEKTHQNARRAIGKSHHDRRRQGPSQPIVRRDRRCATPGERVGRPFESERHGDGGELGDKEQHGREDNARFEIAAIRRPNVRPKIDDRRHQIAAGEACHPLAVSC